MQASLLLRSLLVAATALLCLSNANANANINTNATKIATNNANDNASRRLSGGNGACGLPRVRKPWDSLSPSEQALYVDALTLAIQNGVISQLSEIHMDQMSEWQAHHSCAFFTWHRRLLLALESYLRDLAPRFACVTLPLYDVHAAYTDAANGKCGNMYECSSIFQALGGPATETRTSLRLNGKITSGFIHRGAPFSADCDDSRTQCGIMVRGNLAQRAVPSGAGFGSFLDIVTRSADYKTFLERIQFGLHNEVHNAVSGAMATFASPRDVFFFSWHAAIDMYLSVYHRCHLGDGKHVGDEDLQTSLQLFAEATQTCGGVSGVGADSEIIMRVKVDGQFVDATQHPTLGKYFAEVGDRMWQYGDTQRLGDYSYSYEVPEIIETQILSNTDLCMAPSVVEDGSDEGSGSAASSNEASATGSGSAASSSSKSGTGSESAASSRSASGTGAGSDKSSDGGSSTGSGSAAPSSNASGTGSGSAASSNGVSGTGSGSDKSSNAGSNTGSGSAASSSGASGTGSSSATSSNSGSRTGSGSVASSTGSGSSVSNPDASSNGSSRDASNADSTSASSSGSEDDASCSEDEDALASGVGSSSGSSTSDISPTPCPSMVPHQGLIVVPDAESDSDCDDGEETVLATGATSGPYWEWVQTTYEGLVTRLDGDMPLVAQQMRVLECLAFDNHFGIEVFSDDFVANFHLASDSCACGQQVAAVDANELTVALEDARALVFDASNVTFAPDSVLTRVKAEFAANEARPTPADAYLDPEFVARAQQALAKEATIKHELCV